MEPRSQNTQSQIDAATWRIEKKRFCLLPNYIGAGCLYIIVAVVNVQYELIGGFAVCGVNQTPQRESALHVALRIGHVEAIQLVLESATFDVVRCDALQKTRVCVALYRTTLFLLVFAEMAYKKVGRAKSCSFLADTLNLWQNSDGQLQTFDREECCGAQNWNPDTKFPKWGFSASN